MTVKKITALLLICVFLASALPAGYCSEALELPWGMTREDVISFEGNPSESYQSDDGTYAELTYDGDWPVLMYGGRQTVLFLNDSLVGLAYTLEDAGQEKFSRLASEFRSSYGEEEEDLSFLAERFALFIYKATPTEISKNDLEAIMEEYADAGIMKVWRARSDYVEAEIALMYIDQQHSAETIVMYLMPSE